MSGLFFIVCCFFTIGLAFKLSRYITFSDENSNVEKNFKGELKLEIFFYLFMVILSGFLMIIL
ncbi:MAG: hypothetical protein M0Q88_05840 [Bacilli bacterium]|nr:hypothetical protein [Bacilli bacterium]